MTLNANGFIALLAAALVALPIGASAQTDPAAAAGAPVPSYAKPPAPNGDETVTGRIQSFDGAYSLQVRDDRGFIDNIQLKQGTIINPNGIRLTPGMRVTVYGVNRGSALLANQIDTPYQSYGAVDPYPYPYAYGPYPYPYPVYAYPGPAVSLGIGFGWGYRGRWR